jgi:hypothetical protein
LREGGAALGLAMPREEEGVAGAKCCSQSKRAMGGVAAGVMDSDNGVGCMATMWNIEQQGCHSAKQQA